VRATLNPGLAKWTWNFQVGNQHGIIAEFFECPTLEFPQLGMNFLNVLTGHWMITSLSDLKNGHGAGSTNEGTTRISESSASMATATAKLDTFATSRHPGRN
jgi:hypothetical protein